MTRFRYQVLAAQLFAAWALLFAMPQAAQAVGLIRIAQPSLCLDGMETDHGSDDEDIIAIAADGACMIQSQDIISI
jgi:hypothetical protein